MSDATAAIGISRRRGLGKVRHLATADLWMQDRIRKGDFSLEKIAGADNPADMLTKHVARDLISKHMSTFGLRTSVVTTLLGSDNHQQKLLFHSDLTKQNFFLIKTPLKGQKESNGAYKFI